MEYDWHDEIDDELSTGTTGHVQVSGDEHIYDCPFCDHAKHFYVNYSKGVYNCFVCGGDDDDGSGSLQKLARLLGIDVQSQLPTVENIDTVLDDVEVELGAAVAGPVQDDEVPVAPPRDASRISPYSLGSRFYLHGRGISDQDTALYQIGESHWGQRIYLPDFNQVGQVRWWQSRTFLPWATGPKYLGPSGSKGGRVYGWHIAMAQPVPYLGVVEGPISKIVAGPDCVALWGKEPSQAQIATLASSGRRVMVALDGEAGAFANALGLVQGLRDRGCDAGLVPLPGDEDPASMGRQAFRELLAKSLSGSGLTSDLDYLEQVVSEYL